MEKVKKQRLLKKWWRERREKGSRKRIKFEGEANRRRRGRVLREQSEGTIPLPPLSSPPASLLSFSCSFSCLGHHVLRHPATTASPLHTYRGEESEKERGMREGVRGGVHSHSLTHTCSPGYNEKAEREKKHTHTFWSRKAT